MPTLRAAFDAEATGGEFYGPDGFMEMRGFPVVVQPNELAKNPDIAAKLWSVSEELTRVKFDFDVKALSVSQ